MDKGFLTGKIIQKEYVKRIIVKKNEPLKNELEEFINAIQSRKNPITNYEEAINVQTVMEMIENNLENNQD